MPRWERLAQRGAAPLARSSHSAVLLGRSLLIFGGENTPRTPIDATLHAYDLDTCAWTAHAPGGEAPAPRLGHAAAAAGGALYVFGGREGVDQSAPLGDLWAWRPEAGWARVAQPAGAPWPQARSYAAMAAAPGGAASELFLFGGCGAAGRLNDLWRLDAAAGRWEELPASDAVKPRGGAGMAVRGRQVFVVAGFCGHELDDAHVFDADTAAWAPLPAGDAPPPPARSVAAVAALPGRESLLLVGGELAPSAAGHEGAGRFCAAAFEYGAGGAPGWARLAPKGEAPAPRGWAAAAASQEGLLLHGGVLDDNARSGDLFLLRP